MMTLEQLFEGNQTHRGVLGRFENNKKVAWIEPKPFDWEKHLKGEQPQGLSPVNTETAECRWLCLDIDLKIKPDEFYNLAAQSFVGLSFEQPQVTTITNSFRERN